MTELTQVRLQELRAEHRQCGEHHVRSRKAHCVKCLTEQPWPCEQAQILDLALEVEFLSAENSDYERQIGQMALEAERLRAALERMLEGCGHSGPCNCQPEAVKAARSALAGTEATE